MSNPAQTLTFQMLSGIGLALLISCNKLPETLPAHYKPKPFPFGNSGQLSIVVLNESGKFINGCEIVLTNQKQKYRNTIGPKPGVLYGEFYLVDSEHPIRFTKQTNEHGCVIFKNLKSDWYYLTMSKPGYQDCIEIPKVIKGYRLEVVIHAKPDPVAPKNQQVGT